VKRLGEDLGSHPVLKVAGEEDVRHAQPRWCVWEGPKTCPRRSTLGPNVLGSGRPGSARSGPILAAAVSGDFGATKTVATRYRSGRGWPNAAGCED